MVVQVVLWCEVSSKISICYILGTVNRGALRKELKKINVIWFVSLETKLSPDCDKQSLKDAR